MIAAYAIAISYPSVWMGQTVTVGLSGMLFALLGTISLMSRKWYLNVAVIGCGPICKLSGSIKEHVLNGPLVQTKWKVVDLALYLAPALDKGYDLYTSQTEVSLHDIHRYP